MGVRSRTLEITVISGKNLHMDSNAVTENAYVVVRTESMNCCTTRMAKEGSGSSSLLLWNEKLLLDMPGHVRSITFEVQSKKSKGARPVGVARIAVSDFLGGSSVPVLESNQLQVLSYGLRDWEGRRNGVIHFSVRVAMPEGMAAREKNSGDKSMMGIHVGDKKTCGVVTGFPMWWNYPNII